LRDYYEEIRGTGADLWVIANDDPDKLRELREREGFEFPILLDPDAQIIRAWGLLNDMDTSGRVIPHPTVAILDDGGVVRYFHTETNYRLLPPTADLVERLRALEGEDRLGPEV
jgi:peroxiredoxin